MDGARAIGVQQQMAHRHFPSEGDVRKHLLHDPRRFHRLARAQVQEIDVQAVGFVGEIGGNPDGKPFGVRRASGAIGVQAGQRAVALNQLRVGLEDFRNLAMQTDADMGGTFRIFRHQALCRAHDEFEMRDVITLLRPDHEKFVLMGRAPVQAVSSIKHEDLE